MLSPCPTPEAEADCRTIASTCGFTGGWSHRYCVATLSSLTTEARTAVVACVTRSHPCDPTPAKCLVEALACDSSAKLVVSLDLAEGWQRPEGWQRDIRIVRGVLRVPALGVRRTLFTVPFPYNCFDRDTSPALHDSDAGAPPPLGVFCSGDDAEGSATVRTSRDRIVIDAHDYGPGRAHDEIPIPCGAQVGFVGPKRYPTSFALPKGP